jgi:hypothetical protein
MTVKVTSCLEIQSIQLMAVLAFLKQEPVEPGDDPRIGFGHREVVCP